jgi:hypothetical protein
MDADGDALAQRMQQVELVAAVVQPSLQAAQEELTEVKAPQGWAELPPELLEKVLELLHAPLWREPPHCCLGDSTPREDFGFCKAVAVVRAVCAGWQAVHDAAVTRLVFARMKMTDEAVGMLVRRFPAVASVEFEWVSEGHEVTDEGVLAVSSMSALMCLNLTGCMKVTDAGVMAVSGMPALTCLDLTSCIQITDVGVRALSSQHTLTCLNLSHCRNVTAKGVRALSSLPALTQLDLHRCSKVWPAGVQALRSTTASSNLHIQGPY